MFYEEDLAYIHDVGFTGPAKNAAMTVVKLLRKRRIQSGLVVDLGCGSGVLAERLTKAGYDVLGIDVSESMLRVARQRAPSAKFVCGSLFRFRTELLRTKLLRNQSGCVAITAIGECVNYLFEPNGANQLEEVFRQVHRALAPEGIFVFDVVMPSRIPESSMLHLEGKDWAILVRKQEDARRRVLTRRMTIFRKVGRLYRRSEEVHRQRLYPFAEVMNKLRAVGFQVTRLPGYGDGPLPPGRAGFVARKRYLSGRFSNG